VFHRNRERDDRQNNQELIIAHPILWITGRRHYDTPVSRNGVCVLIFLPCLESYRRPRPPIVEVPRSYSDTSLSEDLIGTSDQRDAETSTLQRTTHTQKTDNHSSGGIRTRNPSKVATAHPRLKTARGHWDRWVCPLRRTEFLSLWLTEACLCGTAAINGPIVHLTNE